MKYAIVALFLFAAGCSSTDNNTNAQASTNAECAGSCTEKCSGEKAKSECCAEGAKAEKKAECCAEKKTNN
ncbi:MAG: hypothetical protein IPK26_00230 [Planctomycetes bacterium]|nr:hypothetical protein [Planctomycetota bacterium]